MWVRCIWVCLHQKSCLLARNQCLPLNLLEFTTQSRPTYPLLGSTITYYSYDAYRPRFNQQWDRTLSNRCTLAAAGSKWSTQQIWEGLQRGPRKKTSLCGDEEQTRWPLWCFFLFLPQQSRNGKTVEWKWCGLALAWFPRPPHPKKKANKVHYHRVNTVHNVCWWSGQG